MKITKTLPITIKVAENQRLCSECPYLSRSLGALLPKCGLYNEEMPYVGMSAVHWRTKKCIEEFGTNNSTGDAE